jgi:hypothetical protein
MSAAFVGDFGGPGRTEVRVVKVRRKGEGAENKQKEIPSRESKRQHQEEHGDLILEPLTEPVGQGLQEDVS